MIEIIAPLLTLILFETIAIKSAKSSVWSPIGMVATTISAALMINPMFEHGGDFLGWSTVVISLVFYVVTTKAIHVYFKLNDNE